ncbi:MAG: hypothetical protein IT238_02175 [Bacteroidia bacterium]|nr:hypothetical protein [Bacteroidia bacterium]MCZ2249391.1 hypothetical protein [Bacteroidia bacterium]
MGGTENIDTESKLGNTPLEKKSSGSTKLAGKKIIRTMVEVINGNFLTNSYSIRQIPFILFLAGVAIFYIANSYYAEKKIRQINRVTNELKELRSEYITSKSELMYVSRQSQIAKSAQNMGLQIKESLTPPNKLKLDEK